MMDLEIWTFVLDLINLAICRHAAITIFYQTFWDKFGNNFGTIFHCLGSSRFGLLDGIS